jgi:hypothetical protein
MNGQLAATGQILSSCVDMAKGHMGPQFAVTILARHMHGPFHLMLGDDDELAVMSAASQLLRMGKHLIKDGVPADRLDEPTLADQMVALLRDCADALEHEGASTEAKASNALADRCKVLLAKVDGEAVQVDPPLEAPQS